MKTFILFTLLSCLLASTLTAQESGSEVYPKQVSIAHNKAVINFSQDFITVFTNRFLVQDLSEAASGINQYAAINFKGNYNIALLQQFGYKNAGVINILGNKNNAFLKQKGSGLQAILEIVGNNNWLSLIQKGNNLQQPLRIFEDGKHIKAYQNNTGLRLLQTGGTIPLMIKQRGGSPIIIH